MKNIKVIAFDFDDTLFNETYFDETEKKFCFNGRLSFSSRDFKELFTVEINNLKLYGYGIKAISYR
jgi:putative hydrolase of the HAD superfamily